MSLSSVISQYIRCDLVPLCNSVMRVEGRPFHMKMYNPCKYAVFKVNLSLCYEEKKLKSKVKVNKLLIVL